MLMKKAAENLTYEKAFAELQQILQDLQNEAVGMDELGEKIERANVLISFCRERLRTAEAKIEQLAGQ